MFQGRGNHHNEAQTCASGPPGRYAPRPHLHGERSWIPFSQRVARRRIPNVHGAPRQQPAHTRKQSLYHKGGWCQIGVRPSPPNPLSHQNGRGGAGWGAIRASSPPDGRGSRALWRLCPRPRAGEPGEAARASSPRRPPPGEAALLPSPRDERGGRRGARLFAPVRPRERRRFCPRLQTDGGASVAMRPSSPPRPPPSVAARVSALARRRAGEEGVTMRASSPPLPGTGEGVGGEGRGR